MLDAVRRLLDGRFKTTVMVADEPSLLETVGRINPDLVVVDLSLPVSGCANVLSTLFERYPGQKAIVLSVHDEEPAVARAVGAGAAGFVLKRRVAIDLIAAVDAVLGGETYVSPTLGWQAGSQGRA
jgi:two-component system secretion response regulator SsrB